MRQTQRQPIADRSGIRRQAGYRVGSQFFTSETIANKMADLTGHEVIFEPGDCLRCGEGLADQEYAEINHRGIHALVHVHGCLNADDRLA
jgi:hypothetical protein